MKYLKPNDIAERFDVTVQTVFYWLNSGKLDGFKVGRMWRMSEENEQDFIKKSTPPKDKVSE